MVAEAIYYGVPKWLVLADKSGFSGGDEVTLNVVEDHEAAAEIFDFQIVGFLNAAGVFAQASVQFSAIDLCG